MSYMVNLGFIVATHAVLGKYTVMPQVANAAISLIGKGMPRERSRAIGRQLPPGDQAPGCRKLMWTNHVRSRCVPRSQGGVFIVEPLVRLAGLKTQPLGCRTAPAG